MNWEEWYKWKHKKTLAWGLFIIAYLLTIPIRDYSSYSVDISQGVPIWLHLVLIIAGLVVIIIGIMVAMVTPDIGLLEEPTSPAM